MDNNKDNLLEIIGLKTYFFTDKGVVPAVDDVSISVGKGRVLGLVGESGCGKSVTALSVMQLISKPGKIVEGKILYDGENLLNKSYKEMCKVRGNTISMIFQEPMTSLNPVYTVGKQVMEVFGIHQNMNKEQAREKTIEMFDLVNIPESEKTIYNYPHQLSGGLRQRVMIAMALACKPKLLIADEPTTALDVTVQAQILRLMKQIKDEFNSSIILITHDLGVVAEFCDDVNVMYAGKVVEYAEVHELFNNPLHPYTLGLLKSLPSVNKNVNRLYNIKGMVPSLLDLPTGCRFSPRCELATDICYNKEPDEMEVAKGHKVRCWKYCR